MKHYKKELIINLKEEKNKNKGKVSKKTPRKHQIEALDKLTNFYIKDGKKRGILKMPTGSGKTYTTVYWLLKHAVSKGKKVLWLADKGFLLEQAREQFRESILEINTAERSEIVMRIVSGSDRHADANSIKVTDDILLITAQTAISHWTDETITSKFTKFVEENAKDDNLIIVYDEAHHTPAYGRRTFLIGRSEGTTGITEKFPRIQLLGLTATPMYTDKKREGWLWEIFNDGIIHKVEKAELQEKEILAIPEFKQTKTNFSSVLSDKDVEQITLQHKDLPKRLITELAENEERNQFIAQYYIDNKEKFGKTIIFLDRWYQCRMVENYLNKKAGKEIALSMFSYVDLNKNISYINNRTKDQNDINLERFKNNEVDVLLNIKMLNEGVDVPDVKTVFITRDTNSTIAFTQMVGRALRGKGAGGNKSIANIILFSDNWNRHIEFASQRYNDVFEDEGKVKVIGQKPGDLIRISLLDKLNFEYESQNFNTTLKDLIPIGWYVTKYVNSVQTSEEDSEATIETHKENILVFENQIEIFENFIADFNREIFSPLWEKEELDYEVAKSIINNYLKRHNIEYDKTLVIKLTKIAQHMGQDIRNTAPTFFTFEQREECDMRKHLKYVIDNKLDFFQEEDYLQNEYFQGNAFLTYLFPNFNDFMDAYSYEKNVYRRGMKPKQTISESSQEIPTKRLLENEKVKKIVFFEGKNQCACCGKQKNLQIDHIISAKEEEPDNDDPRRFQVLCKTCNLEKTSNSYNYKFYNFNKNYKLVDVLTTKRQKEHAEFYFTRLVNCYYKTSAVEKNSVEASNDGRKIWRLKTHPDAKPEDNILKELDELKNIIKNNGYKFKDIIIETI